MHKKLLGIPMVLAAVMAMIFGTTVPALATGIHPAWWCSQGYVCLYDNLNGEGAITEVDIMAASFQGVAFPAGGRNDHATSISTNAGYTRDTADVFYFYTNNNCSGTRLTVSAGYHIPDLRTTPGFNDNISSFAIDTPYSSGGFGPCFMFPTYLTTDASGRAQYAYNGCPAPNQGYCPYYMFGQPD